MLNSGCSRHLTGDQRKFTSLKLKDLGAAFGNNGKLKVLKFGNIELNSNFNIKKVLFVENLKFNLFSISQLCDIDTK